MRVANARLRLSTHTHKDDDMCKQRALSARHVHTFDDVVSFPSYLDEGAYADPNLYLRHIRGIRATSLLEIQGGPAVPRRHVQRATRSQRHVKERRT